MAFKSGERVDEYEEMVETVKGFNEDDFVDLAAYISSLPGPPK
jgi:cytochrome c553